MTARDLLMKYENQWVFLSKEQIDYMLKEAEMNKDTGPEYDSAGFTDEDRIVEGQYMNMYKDTDPDLVQLERGDAYDNYVATVKRNIDQATAEGILKDDCSEGYSYLSKEEWLRRQADQEAQDADLFGENKI